MAFIEKYFGIMSIARNSIYNIVGSVTPLFLALATIPLYLQQVGIERYGALAIVWLILGYFGLFDLGLGRATAYRIAALSEAEPQHRADVFLTAIVVNVAMGILGAILLYLGAKYFFAEHFQADNWLRREALDAVPILAMAVPIATLTGVASGALQGREKFLDVNIANVIGTSLFQLIPLATAYINGPTLKWLVLSALVARIIGFGVFMLRVHRHLLRGLFPRFDSNEWLALLKYGGWVTITSIVSPFLVVIDRFMIGSTISVAAVSIYTIPFEIVQRISLLPRAIAMALFPKLAAASEDQGRHMVQRATNMIIFLVTPVILVGLFAMGPFLEIWVGSEIATGAKPVGIILLLGYWVNAFAIIPYSRLQAAGRPDVVTTILLAQVPFYVGIMYWAVTNYGLTAAAIVFSVRTAIDYVLLHRFSSGYWRISPLAFLYGAILTSAAVANLYLQSFSVAWLISVLAVFMTAGTVFARNMPNELCIHLTPFVPQRILRWFKFV